MGPCKKKASANRQWATNLSAPRSRVCVKVGDGSASCHLYKMFLISGVMILAHGLRFTY